MKTTTSVSVLLALGTLGMSMASAQPTNFGWPYVRIGFTEQAMNTLYHPLSPHRAYVRFDMNFVHRRDAVGQDWKMLNEGFPSNTDLFAQVRQCVGMAIDPNNVNTLYVAGGSGSSSGAGLYKSTDMGATFTKVFPTSGTIYVAGNKVEDRWKGEPIAVDPYNSNVVYFGTQQDGLYRSTNGGTSWTKVANDPAASNWGFKAVRVAQAGTQASPNRGKYVYAYAENDGVYESRDGGSTFTKITGFPSSITDIEISGDNYLYGSGNESDGFYRYNINTLTFQGKRSTVKGNIASMTDSTGKVVMTGNPEDKKGYIYRSTNRGDTWETLSTDNGKLVLDANSQNLINTNSYNLTGGALHPNGQRFLVGGVYNIYETTNVFATTVTLSVVPFGAEKEVNTHLTCPPASPSGNTAELYLGVADSKFYWIDDPQNVTIANEENLLRGYDSDYTEANRDVIWMVSRGGKAGEPTVVLRSTQNGKDVAWNVGNLYPFGTTITTGSSSIAARSTDSNHALVAAYTASNGTLRYTKDGGATWSAPNQAINDVSCSDDAVSMWKTRGPIAADRVNGNYYAYSSISGKFYRSTDGGTNFTTVNTSLPTGTGWGFYFRLQSVPGRANHLLLSFPKGPNTVMYTFDGGSTWGELTEFEDVRAATAGPGFSAAVPSVVYAWGKMPGDFYGVYACANFGATGRIWRRVTDNQDTFIEPLNMRASRQNPGRVFTYANKWHYTEYAVVDALNDWTKSHSHSANLILVDRSSQTTDENDPSVAVRNTTGNGTIVYNVASIVDFSIKLYVYDSGSPTVAIATSADGVTYTNVATTNTNVATSGGWHRRVYTPTGAIPAGRNYLRLTIGGSTYYTPHVSEVKIMGTIAPF